RTVTVDAEWLITRLDAVDRAMADIRKAAAEGVHRTASPSGININLLDWKNKYNDPARDDDAWAWAFSRNYEGGLLPAAEQLVQEIERYGKVEIDGYELTLGGKDKTLLNRKKLKGRR
ncbi:unnamed protein product, partial [marine sediment metagenome]